MKKHAVQAKPRTAPGKRAYGRGDQAASYGVRQTAAEYAVRRRSDRAPRTADDEAQQQILRRQARIAALKGSSGIWAGEPAQARDGLVYQKALRAEWR